ncbi:DUF2062 domain-containing protein [Algicella marina]|uniref:DUF2062 domain-containing protein n=1 Tax=Algicella marina TaxID=2683284 RepID=A0A6P1T5P4_9RHOB|nr:DUF2062 domain-containing protein [Algicella marina]QHQ37075.1 DUF2062 domain-containing protein [Algicella marina]
MVFKRRERQSWLQRARDILYPRAGWRRTIEYLGHRVKRLPDTPHKIALGFACGVFVSFSPLFGFHFVFAGLCAMLVRGNVLASFLGTLVGNPLTFPFIATTSLSLGRRFMGISSGEMGFGSVKTAFVEAFAGLWQSLKAAFGMAEPALGRLEPFWTDIFLPYSVGGIIPGLITAAGFYFLTRPLIAAYQVRRRSRLLERAKEKLVRKKGSKMVGEHS